MYTTQEALLYLQQKYPELQLSLDTFYHAIHRKNFQRSEVASKHDPEKILRRYLFTQEQLDSLTFRAISKNKVKQEKVNNIIQVYSSDDIKVLEAEYGKLLTSDGVQHELSALTHRTYNHSNVRNMQRTGALRIVARIGRAYLYPAKDLETIKLHPSRIKNIDKEVQSVL